MPRIPFAVLALAALLPFPACASGPGTLARDVVFKSVDGRVVYEIEADDHGFEVLDGQEKEIVDYRWVDGSLRIRAASKILGFVRSDAGGVCVTDAEHKELWRLQRDGAEDWMLKSPAGVACKLDRHREGYRFVDAAGKETGRIKVDADHISIRTPDDTVLLKSRLRLSTLAAACMGFDQVPLEQRLGLLVGVVSYRIGE